MITQQIVEKALQKAQSAQALMLTSESSAVVFENDRLKSAASSQRTQIDVKVIMDGKVGVSSTTDPADIEGVVSRAFEAAQFGSPAHFEFPAPETLEPVKIFDPALLPLQKPEMIRMGQHMMEMVKSYNPEILADAEINKTRYQVEYANSNGAHYSADHTEFDVGTGGALVRGNDMLFAGHRIGQKKREVDLEEIATQSIEYFRLAERTAAVASGELPVIFTPRGLAALLLSLDMALDGKNVFLGASPLREKLGQQVASPMLTIRDDPFLEFGFNSGAFDDEGTARKVTPLIDKGILRNFIYDLDTAEQAGVKPTGHGSTRTLTNLVIEPGATPYQAMISSLPQGLLVHQFLGLGQGNPISGEFSVNIMLGYKIEAGKVVGRVKDVMLAGNAFEAIKDITAISTERESVSGPYKWYNGLMPYIQVGKLSVTAK